MKKRHKQRRKINIHHNTGILFAGVIFFVCLFFGIRQRHIPPSHAEQSLICPTSVPGQGLQLQPCYPGTVIPPTSTTMSLPTGETITPAGRIEHRPVKITYGSGTCTGSCCKRGKLPDGNCDSKPVIYLYPTKDTEVSVKVTIPGIITESIPEYPVATGWQHIFAHSNGTFVYQGNIYSELFYETQQNRVSPPTNGFIVSRDDVTKTLRMITTKLGFLPAEQTEFLNYWVTRLTSLKTEYVFISLFNPQEKQAIDQVTIAPTPDTFLQYIFYFKGTKAWYPVEPLSLPSVVAQRNGFTAFEWGGIVDY